MKSRQIKEVKWFLPLSLFFLTCSNVPVPGEQKLLFDFSANLSAGSCPQLTNAEVPFKFSAWFSLSKNKSQAYFTVNNSTRDADFDGQFVTTVTDGERFFDTPECLQCRAVVQETVKFALLSLTQSSAANDVCPVNVLDGGVPAADANTGVELPGGGEKFDAVRACGEVNVNFDISPKTILSFCPDSCRVCHLVYTLDGVRRE